MFPYKNYKHRGAKLGDTIMRISAMHDQGGDLLWYLHSKKKNGFTDFHEKLLSCPKYKVADATGLGPMYPRVFPIVEPTRQFPRPQEGKYVVTCWSSANDERRVVPPEIETEYDIIDVTDAVGHISVLWGQIQNAEHFYGSFSGPTWVAASCRIPSTIYETNKSTCNHHAFNIELLLSQDYPIEIINT